MSVPLGSRLIVNVVEAYSCTLSLRGGMVALTPRMPLRHREPNCVRLCEGECLRVTMA